MRVICRASKLPPSVSVLGDLTRAVDGASLIVVATPIGALVDLVEKLRSKRRRSAGVGSAKGFVADRRRRPASHWLIKAIAPLWRSPVGVISGPSFAEEVARGLPTAVSVAATERTLAEDVAQSAARRSFRAYVSDDLIGIEVGGAIKNVLAIAAGASDGLGFGNNARAALVTRGLAETGRLSIALGGKRETLMGLAGLGDLVLTCTGDLSRNRRVGLALAAGERPRRDRCRTGPRCRGHRGRASGAHAGVIAGRGNADLRRGLSRAVRESVAEARGRGAAARESPARNFK